MTDLPDGGGVQRTPSTKLVERMRRVASIFQHPAKAPFLRAYGSDDYEYWARLLLEGARALETADQEVAALLESAPASEKVIQECWSILGHAYADQSDNLPDCLRDIAKRLQASENPPDYSAGWNAAMESIEVRERLAALRAASAPAGSVDAQGKKEQS